MGRVGLFWKRCDGHADFLRTRLRGSLAITLRTAYCLLHTAY